MTRDEQMAREWLALQGIAGWAEGSKDYAIRDLAALLARRALEEAKWWRPRTDLRHDDDCSINLPDTNPASDFCTCDVTLRLREANARIAALEQAAAGGGQ